ncbi:MAG TPA: TetR/AcrR family transcriptional regulator [Pseudomonas xinjiangensis]|uniref:TetR/AcrR family transcriptional regulator n=2 Tax=root TaxID=1 RepID=A0A7V1BRF9_9GAMM|nr:TetR/AcrR family transcriptional regulator [Halopseudomonas xinjiangensis]HEC49034.1 TetR/AcrR family transcriptional regulator [Halopseudomonas xinjiangensis]
MLNEELDDTAVIDEVQESVAPKAGYQKVQERSKAKKAAPRLASGSGKTRAVKPNKRSEETINSILQSTEEVVLQSGADRISILDVCKSAGVSRGTFYRYFSSQEDLLDTFSRHKRDHFHQVLMNTIGTVEDPEARLNALITFIDNYLEQSRAQRLLVVAPEYALGFFRRIFHDSILRFQDTLDIVFDDWDEKLGVKLDRELICEMIIRYVLSEILVPENSGRRLLPARVRRLVASLTMGSTSRTRR